MRATIPDPIVDCAGARQHIADLDFMAEFAIEKLVR
jgi:hypothetical protein